MDEAARSALAEHATPLSTTDPGVPLDDLATVGDRLGAATVVGLGEGTHGTREFLAIRHRLARLLVGGRGFGAVAVEAGAGEAAALSEYVATGAGDPRAALARLDGWWHTEGALALVRWLRSHDEGRPPGDRVGLYGVDVGDPAPAADRVRSFLREADPDRYRSVAGVLDPVADGELSADPDPEALAAAADLGAELAEGIAAHSKPDADGPPAWRVHLAAHCARALSGTCEWLAAGGAAEGYDPAAFERRDRAMADAVVALVERHGPTAALAHNGHVKRGTFDDGRVWADATTMGECLDRRFGDGYRAVVTAFGRGGVRAADGCADDGEFRSFALGDPPEGSVEAALAALDHERLAVDVRAAGRDPRLAGWFDRRPSLRNVTVSFDPGAGPGRYRVEWDLAASVDDVVFVRSVAAARGIDPGGTR